MTRSAPRSILHYTLPDLALYVVDNGVRRLRQAAGRFRRQPRDCAAAGKEYRLRQGPQLCAGSSDQHVHFILNPDILLTGDVLEDMAVAAAADPARGRHGNAPAALPGRVAAPALPQADALAAAGAAAGPEARCCFKKADDHYTMQERI